MSLGRREFEAALRRIGEERYHDRHPFNVRMHEGALTPDALRCWVRNRYYYQTRIPIKDGRILAKAEQPLFRREWIERIHDHDGQGERPGGLELWLHLAEAVGLDRHEVESLRGVLPGVRRACDEYVQFVESHDLLECVAASLTELFAGGIMKDRIAAFERHYTWVGEQGLRYFRSRTEQAPRDSTWALAYVLDGARTQEEQERCLQALERKCGILWKLLDSVEGALRRLRLSPHALVRTEEPDQKTIVVLPERAVKVNPSGREILDLCDGSLTAEGIAAKLRGEHPDIEQLEGDVHEFLDRMEGLGVLESVP